MLKRKKRTIYNRVYILDLNVINKFYLIIKYIIIKLYSDKYDM